MGGDQAREQRSAAKQFEALELSQLPGFERVSDRARRLLNCDLPVLIVGETGSGKSMLARWIHHNSDRRNNILTVRGAGSLHDESLVAELFGYVRGAFTGALKDQKGLLRGCDGGTLILDDIDTLSTKAQARLLHFMEHRVVTPLGAPNSCYDVDVRIIGTANSDLAQAMRSGLFREDLYYRLSTFTLRVPSLRLRVGDIQYLVRQFEHEFEHRCPDLFEGQRLDIEAIRLLELLELPGNTRELRNVIFQVLAQAETRANARVSLNAMVDVLLAPEIGHDHFAALRHKVQEDNATLHRLLRHTQRNISMVSRITGFSRQTIYNRIEKHGL